MFQGKINSSLKINHKSKKILFFAHKKQLFLVLNFLNQRLFWGAENSVFSREASVFLTSCRQHAMCNNNSLVLKDGRAAAAFVGDSIFMLVELKMTMSKYPRACTCEQRRLCYYCQFQWKWEVFVPPLTSLAEFQQVFFLQRKEFSIFH